MEKLFNSKNVAMKYILACAALTSIIVIIFLIPILTGYSSSKGQENVVLEQKPIKTEISLSIKDFNYYPRTIYAKKGIPVELTLDSSVGGCYRTLSISKFNVYETSSSPEDKIIFTPDSIGIFKFSCGMGMGYGTLIVE